MEAFYYVNTIKNINTSMLKLFQVPYVVQYTSAGVDQTHYDVPFQWGNIDKTHKDRLENNYYDTSAISHGDRFYMTLPRMSLKMDSLTYDPRRASGVNTWRHFNTSDEGVVDLYNYLVDYPPTPYTISYSLYIKSKSMDYLSQILENILPYFNPTVTVRVKEFSFLNLHRDIKVTMVGCTTEFDDDMGNADVKYSNATLNFTAEAWLYRPITSAAMIKFINSKYYINTLEDNYITSGAIITSAGLDTSAVPDSYISSGGYSDSYKEYDWFKGTSAIEGG